MSIPDLHKNVEEIDQNILKWRIFVEYLMPWESLSFLKLWLKHYNQVEEFFFYFMQIFIFETGSIMHLNFQSIVKLF